MLPPTLAPTIVDGANPGSGVFGRRLGVVASALAVVAILAGAGYEILSPRAAAPRRVDEELRLADTAFDQWNYAEALQRYRKLAEAGSPLAETRLGQMYQGGLGVARDYGAAADWYRKAAEGATRAPRPRSAASTATAAA